MIAVGNEAPPEEDDDEPEDAEPAAAEVPAVAAELTELCLEEMCDLIDDCFELRAEVWWAMVVALAVVIEELPAALPVVAGTR